MNPVKRSTLSTAQRMGHGPAMPVSPIKERHWKNPLEGMDREARSEEFHWQEQTDHWSKISNLVVPVVLAYGFILMTYEIYHEMTHEHHEEGPAYSHMKVRRKPFPWNASDCDFLDLACHRRYKESKS